MAADLMPWNFHCWPDPYTTNRHATNDATMTVYPRFCCPFRKKLVAARQGKHRVHEAAAHGIALVNKAGG